MSSNIFRVTGTPSFYMSQLPVIYSGSNSGSPVGEVSLSTYINNGTYDSNGGGLSFSSIAQPGEDQWHINLKQIHDWHMSNATNICASNIPGSFNYPYDGYTIDGKQCFMSVGGGLFSSNFGESSGVFSQAGGEIMAIQSENTFNSFIAPIAYGDMVSSNSMNSMGYMVTKQGAWPHTMLTYSRFPETLQLGSFYMTATNGTSTLSNSQTNDETQTQLTYSTSNGRYGEMYITTAYGGVVSSNNLLTSNHPSMIEVYYTICDSNWPQGEGAFSGTQILQDFRRQEDVQYSEMLGFGSAMMLVSSYCLVGRSLLATSNGQIPPDMGDVRRFVTSYVSQMPISISASYDPNSNVMTDLSAFFIS